MNRFDWPMLFALLGSSIIGISAVLTTVYWVTKAAHVFAALPK
jgi:hypothetical protein